MQQELPASGNNLRAELTPLRGLWPGIEQDLLRLGIMRLADLCGRDAKSLAEGYCASAVRPFDPLLHPYFTALIRFAETGMPVPWWYILRGEISTNWSRLSMPQHST